MLHDWHEFYLLLGTAAAALLALLFVAVSIGVGFFTERSAGATRIYLSPVVIHFASVLFVSALALAPIGPFEFAIVVGLNGVFGVAISAYITLRIFTDRSANVAPIDRYAYGLVPALAYAGFAVGAALAVTRPEWAAKLLAAAILLLLLVNIRNAWDLMLTVVRRQSRRR